ncbi:MAG: hypothetical protein KDC32_11880 [Saprospiraceae bacterium]|nr:hypothetical protein [Saprospiraceae bacterium]MCB0681597.1 hypothetical protein [Saprospiraceae bacterium]
MNNKPIVKILGERNSGTNYLHHLLRLNFSLDILPGVAPDFLRTEHERDHFFERSAGENLGWKHALAPDLQLLHRSKGDPDRVVFLTITKNPYSWLWSLYRRPYHATQLYDNFDQFLQTPWKTVKRENAPTQFDNPVELWNKKNISYLELTKYATALNLRYEDFLVDFEHQLRRISDFLGQTTKQVPFQNQINGTKRNGLPDFFSYRRYYLGEHWRHHLTNSQIALINNHLDPDLLQSFGYPEICTDSQVTAQM